MASAAYCRHPTSCSRYPQSMESHLLAGLAKLKLDHGRSSSRHDDDLVDRVHHQVTPLLLILFTLLISARQYIGKPIACWVPTEFTRAQEEYAESVCWVTATYFVQASAPHVPEQTSLRENAKLHYYPWVPFVLMLQAALCNLPYLLWRLLNWQADVNLSGIMEVASELNFVRDQETKQLNVDYVCSHLEEALRATKRHQESLSYHSRLRKLLRKCCCSRCCCCCGRHQNSYLVQVYLVVKVLYLGTVAVQFVLMMHFLGTQRLFYGLHVLQRVATGQAWEETGHFPRIAMCDFVLRKLGNQHRHTVQCVLPINMFNEKIYIFLWFWWFGLTVWSCVNWSQWLLNTLSFTARLRFVSKILIQRDALSPSTFVNKEPADFVKRHLGLDGVFILQLMHSNLGEVVVSEVLERLWHNYLLLGKDTTIEVTPFMPLHYRPHNNRLPPILPTVQVSPPPSFPGVMLSNNINQIPPKYFPRQSKTSPSSTSSTSSSMKPRSISRTRHHHHHHSRSRRSVKPLSSSISPSAPKGVVELLMLKQVDEDPGELV